MIPEFARVAAAVSGNVGIIPLRCGGIAWGTDIAYRMHRLRPAVAMAPAGDGVANAWEAT